MNREELQEEYRELTGKPIFELNKNDVAVSDDYMVWLENKIVKGRTFPLVDVISRFLTQRKLGKEVEQLAYYLGVEKSEDKEILRKWNKGRRLLDGINDYVKNGL